MIFSFDDTSLDLRFMLESIIRFEAANLTNPIYYQDSAKDFPPSEMLKLFKSVIDMTFL